MAKHYKAIWSTFLHMLEVLVAGLIVIGLAWLAANALGWDVSEDVKVMLVAVIAGIPKFMRASDSVPVSDYINK